MPLPCMVPQGALITVLPFGVHACILITQYTLLKHCRIKAYLIICSPNIY